MILTTLCYLQQDDKLLLLHRTKKENDVNHDKYIGLGGHFEEGESPEECMKREVFEECGIALSSYRYRGIVTFVSDRYESEQMHLFTAPLQMVQLPDCDEGELVVVNKKDLSSLYLWEGDYIFLSLLYQEEPFFSLKLVYKGDALEKAILNGKEIETKRNGQ